MATVVWASMPYAFLFKPCIGLDLLQAALKRPGIPCHAQHATRDRFPDLPLPTGSWN
jgi:hypothetical protein